jgi:selenocysteine lyase/cysteine desulfurase
MSMDTLVRRPWSAKSAVKRLAADARRFDLSPAWFSSVGTAPALAVVQRIGVAGRVRASFHVYSTRADVDLARDVLAG